MSLAELRLKAYACTSREGLGELLKLWLSRGALSAVDIKVLSNFIVLSVRSPTANH